MVGNLIGVHKGRHEVNHGRSRGILQYQDTILLLAVLVPESLNEDGEIQNDIPIPSHDGKIIELMALRTELEKLPAIDRELVKLRFFKRVTQSAAARQLGMTQVQVSRREKKILELLRKKLGSF